MKSKEWCTILSQEEIASEIYSMWLETPSIAAGAVPGQFVSLYCEDKSRLLPRPISLCEIDRKNSRIRLVYRVAGAGTAEFSQKKAGEKISVLGPLGNGFPMEQTSGRRVILFGGGIGIPPMLETAKQLQGKAEIVLGYRDQRFLQKEFEAAGNLHIATEDGSFGTKGNVLDAVREQKIEGEIAFACGPAPMLRAVKEWAEQQKVQCWISMEERMACGIGACLACVCRSGEIDEHSQVHNKRVCKDGPVFPASEVEL